jgi:hypothetical protein
MTWYRVRDVVNKIEFDIIKFPKPNTDDPVIPANRVGVALYKILPQDKIDVIKEWRKTNPHVPLTLWYHSDLVGENMGEWEKLAKQHKFALCDLKKIESFLEPKDLEFTHYFMKGPNVNFATASNVYRILALRYMLSLTRFDKNVADHEIGFIYADNDLRPGNKKLPNYFDGCFKMNSFAKYSQDIVNLIYYDRQRANETPILGRVQNDLVGVAGTDDILNLLAGLQAWVSNQTFTALAMGDHFLAADEANRVDAYKERTGMETGSRSWTMYLTKQGLMHAVEYGAQNFTEAVWNVLPDSVKNINKYFQFHNGFYFEPDGTFKTDESEGSWVAKDKEGKPSLVFKKYKEIKELEDDLSYRLAFELKYLKPGVIFTNAYMQYIGQQYPQFFSSQKQVDVFVSNIFSKLINRHPELKSVLQECKIQGQMTLENTIMLEKSPTMCLRPILDPTLCGASSVLNQTLESASAVSNIFTENSQGFFAQETCPNNASLEVANLPSASLSSAVNTLQFAAANYNGSSFNTAWAGFFPSNKEHDLTEKQVNQLREYENQLNNISPFLTEVQVQDQNWVEKTIKEVKDKKTVSANTFDNIQFKMQRLKPAIDEGLKLRRAQKQQKQKESHKHRRRG